MTEPTGHTMDGTPWVEPRGPHLPDRLSAVGWLAWPFVILAGILAGLAWPRIVDVRRLAGGGARRCLCLHLVGHDDSSRPAGHGPVRSRGRGDPDRGSHRLGGLAAPARGARHEAPSDPGAHPGGGRRRRRRRPYARSSGSVDARFRRNVTPASTDSDAAYGPGIRKHGRPARATPVSCPHGSSRGRPAATDAARL